MSLSADDWRSRGRGVAGLGSVARTAVAALGVQAGLGLAYLLATDAGVAAPTTMAIPLVWVTAAVVAVVHVGGGAATGGRRVVAVAAGAAYSLGLSWTAGLVSAGTGPGVAGVALLPPWWGPVVRYHGSVALTLFPYRVVGYAALGYLICGAVGDALAGDGGGVRRSAGGLVAVLSCVGCAVPLLTALGAVGGAGAGAVAAVAAGAGAVGGVTGTGPYLLGTAAYLSSVVLLAVGRGEP